MSALRLATAAILLLGLPLAAREEPPLPVWDEEERSALKESGWVPGAVLLNPEPLPDFDSDAAELIPPGLEDPTAAELAEDEVPSTLIPEEFIGDYFAARPETFLIDPQDLLGSEAYAERLGFLKYHADDSDIDFFIYVFSGDQEIPTDVRGEETIERYFSEGRPAAVVFYFLGAPERSILYLSPTLTDVVSAPEQRRALQSSMMQAFSRQDPIEEFIAFSVQMSIRIYWMERILSGEATGEPPSDLAATAAALIDGPAADEAAAKPRGPFEEFVSQAAMPAALAFVTLIGLFGFGFWVKTRARYRFPDFEVEPRLGGPHAAGIGAVISFASASTPPASQRNQVPDYLRRL